MAVGQKLTPMFIPKAGMRIPTYNCRCFFTDSRDSACSVRDSHAFPAFIFIFRLLQRRMFPVLIFVYYRSSKREKHEMIELFGDEFRRYTKKTLMFMPKLVNRAKAAMAARQYVLAIRKRKGPQEARGKL